jgi:hypothetical protein
MGQICPLVVKGLKGGGKRVLDPQRYSANYRVRVMNWNAGWGHNVKTDNSSIERVEEFKYLEMMLTDESCMRS